jgi:hypothetical protein
MVKLKTCTQLDWVTSAVIYFATASRQNRFSNAECGFKTHLHILDIESYYKGNG